MRRRWWVLPCAALVLSGVAPGPATAQAPEQVRDGRSQPVFTAEPVRETVWVETGLDGDGDGVVDRVAADVVRPSGTDRPVPVIMDASPYYSCCGRGNESERKTYDEQGRPLGFPLFYDNFFVGGPSDITSAKAVVDWLNGRAPGFDAPTGGDQVEASWSTGDVGMIGKSYDGTIANGVAATGVEGLRTIVPIGAISSWYDYYRSDGVSFGFDPAGLAETVEEGGRPDCGPVKQQLTEGAPADGDRTPLWTERDHVPDAGRVTASVFAVHGLGDLNVKTVQLGQWWDALAQHGVPRKLWLSQTGHVDPFDFRRAEWVDTLHRWFDHWLLGVDNGIEDEPAASVERAPDVWVDEPTWSGELAEDVVLHPREDGLGPQPGSGTASFTDDPSLDEYDWVAEPDQPSPARVLFSTAPVGRDVRIAGTGSVTVTAVPSTPTAHLSAVLVDYGPATTRDYLGQGEGIRTLETESCWGESRPGDDACYHDTEATTADVDFEVVARGWADLANHESLDEERPLEPGVPRTMTFRLATTDHVVPAGHRLALVIGGTDSAFIVAPRQPGEVGIDLSGTSVTLPVVGGLPAVAAAGTSLPTVRPDHAPARPHVQLNRDVPAAR
ncbi:Xaa-Pro dipeptidyl-peptidase [Saccharopolyspora hordei]|uniref:X-Pro dipeptidyl-peptidase n=1 Tax=Saccharopolyspora hordei TaxID=1838 RepID=A0A853AF82_9PSEU|nr:X-Pro dipeptidyl-peptidase [Saccharopolyspora hordei]